jgi:hypothetical protein
MIVIHFPPGARGDFLAGFLLDRIVERDNFAVYSPPKTLYTKIHFTDNFDFLKKSDAIKIRIDANHSAKNYMRIAENHFNKNNSELEIKLNDKIDQHYLFIKDIINRDYETHNYKKYYDYWIDFSMVGNFNFLWDLYKIINKTTPDEFLLKSALSNIEQQTTMPDNFNKLSELLDFEIKCNLLNYYRSFDYNDFLNSTDSSNLLKLSNYSKEKFQCDS